VIKPAITLKVIRVEWPTACPEIRAADLANFSCRPDAEALAFEERQGRAIAALFLDSSPSIVEVQALPGSGSVFVFWLAYVYDAREELPARLLVAEPGLHASMVLSVQPGMILHWSYLYEKMPALGKHYEIVRIAGLLGAIRDALARSHAGAD